MGDDRDDVRAGPAAGEPIVIELGVAGDDHRPDPPMPARMTRTMAAILTALLVAVAVGASAAGPAGLDGPLWTGTVSLNGFTLGAHSFYEATPDARTVRARDLATGRLRWSLPVDAADLPHSSIDVGPGVVAVTTYRLQEAPEQRAVHTVRFVRESTGEVIARTAGWFTRPGPAGVPLVIFSDRPRECDPREVSCVDVTAWDVATGTVRWRQSLPLGTAAIMSDAADGLAEVDPDGSVRLRDVRTGEVAGVTRLSPAIVVGAQVVLTSGALVTALRAGGEIVLTAYRRPTLALLWSVTVAAPMTGDEGDYGFRGGVQLIDCGDGYVCLYPDRYTGRIVETRTGRVSAPMTHRPTVHLGAGLFLAERLVGDTAPGDGVDVVVDQTGRVVAEPPSGRPLSWEDAGTNVLLGREGQTGTEFLVLDGRARVRSLGTVDGTGLSCAAKGRYLSCSDAAGTLRTWRLPGWTRPAAT